MLKEGSSCSSVLREIVDRIVWCCESINIGRSVELYGKRGQQYSLGAQLTRLGGRILFLPLPASIIASVTSDPLPHSLERLLLAIALIDNGQAVLQYRGQRHDLR